MKHIIALIIKFVFVAIFTFSVMGIFNIPLSSLVVTSLVLTIVTYFIGDLFIYRRFGNLTASVADFVLYFVLLSVIAYYVYNQPLSRSLLSSFFTTIFLTSIDALYHEFVINRYFNNKEETTVPIRNTQYSTEYSEEIDPKADKNKKE